MPNYIITNPDGKRFKVTAPEGASQEEVLSFAQNEWAKANPTAQNLTKTDPGQYDPSSPEFQKRFGPLSASNFENFRAGWGKSAVDLGRGVKQNSPVLFEPFGIPKAMYRKFQEDVLGKVDEEDLAARKAYDLVKKNDAPLMDTKAGLAGNISGSVANTLPTMFIPGVNTYSGAALLGAGTAGLQPVGTEDSRLRNMSIGAGGALAGKYVGGKIGNWATRSRPQGSAERQAAIAAADAEAAATTGEAAAQAGINGEMQLAAKGGGYSFGSVGDDASAGLTPMQKQVLERGKQLGFKATPGQASGSKALQQLEAKLESQPMTSGPFNVIKENNARMVSREAAAAIGETGDALDAPTLEKAFTRLSGVFDDAADDAARPIDPQQFLERFSQVQTELKGVSKGFSNNELVQQLVEHAENGQATGKQLQSLTSKLGKVAYREMTSPSGDRDLGQGLYQMKDYVDDLLESGMNGKRLAKFQLARKQYRNLMLLTSRVGILNPSTGNVNGRALASLLQQKDKAGFLRGQNTSGMYDAARFAQAFGPIVGDSGTATRTPINGATEFLMRVPYNIAAKAYTSPASVSVAAKAGTSSKIMEEYLRRFGGTAPYYAPYALPAAGAPLALPLGRE